MPTDTVSPRHADTPLHSHIGREGVSGPILVATDGGPGVARLIDAARLVAAQWHTTVEIVSVLPSPAPHYGVAMGLEPPPPPTSPRRADERRRVLRAIAHGAGADTTELPIVVRRGAPARIIAREARERHASLIVMGRGPGDRLGRRLGGDVAARTVRVAHCPVLSLVDRWATLPRRIVVATDFSIPSVWAAETAARLLHPRGRLDLVHVVPTIEAATEGGSQWSSSYREWCDERLARLQALLSAITPCTARMQYTAGEPAMQILAELHVMDATLLAVGSAGAGALERWIVGSVATTLLHHASSDLLVAPPPPPAEVDRLSAAMAQRAEHRHEAEWAEVLAGFSVRNQGRISWLETVDPERNAFAQEHGYAFFGASYDPISRRVMLMLGDEEEPRRHLSRAIADVRSIAVHAGAHGREGALSIWHGEGVTELRFLDERE